MDALARAYPAGPQVWRNSFRCAEFRMIVDWDMGTPGSSSITDISDHKSHCWSSPFSRWMTRHQWPLLLALSLVGRSLISP